jgi:predicted ArsR family transcriptional regulator
MIKLQLHSKLEEQLISLLGRGPMTRGDMVKSTNIPRTTIYDALKKLMIRNVVKKYPLYVSERQRGRPKIMFELVE